MPLQAPKLIMMNDVVHGVIIQHCSLVPTLTYQAFSPCIITGGALRPDLRLVTADRKLFALELTMGFETNSNINSQRE